MYILVCAISLETLELNIFGLKNYHSRILTVAYTVLAISGPSGIGALNLKLCRDDPVNLKFISIIVP